VDLVQFLGLWPLGSIMDHPVQLITLNEIGFIIKGCWAKKTIQNNRVWFGIFEIEDLSEYEN